VSSIKLQSLQQNDTEVVLFDRYPNNLKTMQRKLSSKKASSIISAVQAQFTGVSNRMKASKVSWLPRLIIKSHHTFDISTQLTESYEKYQYCNSVGNSCGSKNEQWDINANL